MAAEQTSPGPAGGRDKLEGPFAHPLKETPDRKGYVVWPNKLTKHIAQIKAADMVSDIQ